MKVEFKNINEKHFQPGRVFYLYGNYKKTFGAFCDFAITALRNNFSDVNVHFCTVSECLKDISEQCDLFGTSISCFCIRNAEDNHMEKIKPYLGNADKLFILESGDYGKSKKITDFFVNDRNFCAVASFKNNLTLQSIIKMIMPNVSVVAVNKISDIINNTDEDLLSLLKKISLLCENNDIANLQEYATYKQSFWEGLDFIPLVRLLLQSAIKQKVFDKSFGDVHIGTRKDDIEFLLNAELKQKYETELTKSYLYNRMRR